MEGVGLVEPARYDRKSPVTGESTMSQPLIVSVPHRLGRQEARRRLDRGIGRLQRELGVLLGWLDYHWQGAP
jgi:hypothetical protein